MVLNNNDKKKFITGAKTLTTDQILCIWHALICRSLDLSNTLSDCTPEEINSLTKNMRDVDNIIGILFPNISIRKSLTYNKVIYDISQYEKPKTLSIFDVANFIISFGKEHGDWFSYLKLQKLCYYAEAYYLAMFDKPLTGESFEAWATGPISKKLWAEMKENNYEHWKVVDYNETERPSISRDIESFLIEFYAAFSGYSSYQLELMVCSEQPWLEARGNLPREAACSTVIDPESMRTFYKRYIKEEI